MATVEELQEQNKVLEAKVKEIEALKKFDQKQVDDMIITRLKKAKEEQGKLVGQLKEFKANKALNDDQRNDLQLQIDNLQSTLLTKEEIASKEKDVTAKKYEKDLTTAKESATEWQTRYTDATIIRSIVDAAVVEEVLNPEQIVAILRPSTRLVEEDGKFIPKAKIQGKDKDDKPVTLDLPIAEAIKQMKDMSEHGNLFKSGSTGGTGSSSLGPGKGEKLGDLKDTTTYIEARKKGLSLDKVQ